MMQDIMVFYHSAIMYMYIYIIEHKKTYEIKERHDVSNLPGFIDHIDITWRVDDQFCY